ncbi:hypothetical protein BD769DRAFT_1400780 [Suillus cothurnatus]|nr:hypothetical protein BD769DRAFT_1400780 [Suillus cothurnatus]
MWRRYACVRFSGFWGRLCTWLWIVLIDTPTRLICVQRRVIDDHATINVPSPNLSAATTIGLLLMTRIDLHQGFAGSGKPRNLLIARTMLEDL